MIVKTVRGKEIWVGVKGYKEDPYFKELEIGIDGVKYRGKIQDWRDHRKVSNRGIFFKMEGQRIYAECKEEELAKIENAIASLPEKELPKVIKKIKKTVWVDQEVETEVWEFQNIGIIEDKNGNVIDKGMVGNVLDTWEVKEISLQDFLARWNEEFAEKYAEAVKRGAEVLQRIYEADKIEVGPKQAMENLFGGPNERVYEREGQD